MTVRINKQKINLREKLAGVEDKVNFDEVVRGLGEYTGSVGIGTTNPTALSLKDKLVLHDGFIVLSRSTATSNFIKFVEEDNASFKVGTDIRENGFFIAGQSFSNDRFLTVKNDGNVGIGTTDPERLLTLSSVNPIIQIEATGGNGKQWSIISSDDTTGVGAASGPGHFVIYDDSASTPRFTITDGGNVGIGTTDPAGDLHVSDGGSASQICITSNDNSVAGLYLGDQTRGFRGGVIYNNSSDSLGLWGYAATGFTAQRMTIDSGGNVGIGTTSPGTHLDIQSSGKLPLRLYRETTTTTDDMFQVLTDVGGTRALKFYVEADGDVISATNSFTSDERAKTEISDLSYGLDKINQLKPKQFKMLHSEEKGFKYGFVAQDIEDILPDLVRQKGLEDGEGGYYKALEYNSMIAVLTKAIQEQQTIINDLKSRIETLEQQ